MYKSYQKMRFNLHVQLMGDWSVGKKTFIHRLKHAVFNGNPPVAHILKKTKTDQQLRICPNNTQPGEDHTIILSAAMSKFCKDFPTFTILSTDLALSYKTSIGDVDMIVLQSPKNEILDKADCIIYLCDLMNPSTFTRAMSFKSKVPVMYLGNKADTPDRVVKQNGLVGPYYDISSKTGYNFPQFIIHMFRMVLKREDCAWI